MPHSFRSLFALMLLPLVVRVAAGDGPVIFPPPAAPIAAAEAEDPNSTPWHPPGKPPEPAVAPQDTLPEPELPLPENGGTTGRPLTADEAAATPLLPEGDVKAGEEDWYLPTYWFGPEPWDTGIELGLNGSNGNQDSLSLRTGGYIKRESRFSKLDFSGYYNRTSAGSVTTQNNAQLDVRNDWLLDEHSPWTLFATSTGFYDEFQSFDAQVNANTGIGYRFWHEPARELTGRVGGGASREFGGPDDRWVPESLFGVEYSQKFFATQKFYGKLDYFPEWDQVGEYRTVADVGWEVELVRPSNLSLKISAIDRYDSTPSGGNPHLLNYSVLMLMKL